MHIFRAALRTPRFIRMASTATTIKSLDHIVLTVKSIPKTNEWYTKNLGMKSESFVSAATPDITRYSLIFGAQKINLHELGKVGSVDLYLFNKIPSLLVPLALLISDCMDKYLTPDTTRK